MHISTLLLLASLLTGLTTAASAQALATAGHKAEKVEVLIVGFDHFSQLYNQTAASDVLQPARQQELARLLSSLQRFRPDQVLVEVDPREQPQLDSLYQLFRADKVPVTGLSRSETYQVGFVLAKRLGHATVRGVDVYSATSQGMLNKGQNIEYYQTGLSQLQQVARTAKKQFQNGELTVGQHVALLNRPENIQLSHRVLYNTAAYVVNGRFRNPGPGVDTSRIEPRYIGAEFISLFYNRNLKIYSNILTAQLAASSQRLLLIIGQAHVGVLQELLASNPSFRVVPAGKYLR